MSFRCKLNRTASVDITVIICTLNRCLELQKTLEAFKSLILPTGCVCEVIVVDNGSTDSTRSVVEAVKLKAMEVCYVYEAKRGQAFARNTGMDRAKGAVIVFTDDDVRPDPEWLVEITEPIRSERCSLNVGPARIASHLIRPWMRRIHKTMLACVEASDAGTATGVNFSFSRNVLGKVPRFDPELGPGRMGFWDDALFSLQLKKAGYRFAATPTAAVTHHFLPDRLTRKSFLRRADAEGRSIAYVAWHWDHHKIENARRLALRKRSRLILTRLVRRTETQILEGCPEWEISLVQQIAYFSQYFVESKRSPTYERHGLVKLSGKLL